MKGFTFSTRTLLSALFITTVSGSFAGVSASELELSSNVEEQINALAATDTSVSEQIAAIDGNDLDLLLQEDDLGQVTSVSQLSDVQPTDWAFQAVQSLVERYGCIAGYPDGTFRGNRSASRYELAAALNACLDNISDRFASQEDLETVRALQAEFQAELATLRGRVDGLEARTATLEAQQFSTTTKLSGTAVFLGQFGSADGGNAGFDVSTDGFGGPGFGSARASAISTVYLSFNTSFSGEDLLDTTLFFGNGGTDLFTQAALGDTTAGAGLTGDRQFLNPSQNFFAGAPNAATLYRLSYRFKPVKDLSVTVAPQFFPTDIVDANSYTNPFTGFSTWFFVNNPLITPFAFNFTGGAGGGFDFNPSGGPVSFRGVYSSLAPEGNSPVALPSNIAGDGDGGLFDGPYQATAELEFAPNLGKVDGAIRLQYTNSEVDNLQQDVIGVNVEATLGRVGIFGRYGFSFADANGAVSPVPFDPVTRGRFDAQSWQAGLALNDFLIPGATLSAAAGQPFINNLPSAVGINDQEQFNVEAFYRVPVNDNITVSPIFSAIINPNNSSVEPNLFQGLIRAVFSF